MGINKENKIYKYTSLESAIKILKNNSVKLEFPNNYNDPFDSAIDIRQKDIDKSLGIITEYYVAQEFLKLLNNKDIKVKKHVRIIMDIDIFLLKLYLNTNRKNKYYDSIPMMRCIAKLIIKIYKKHNVDEFNNTFKSQSELLFETIKEFRNKALISCFSKRNDSILMWSHYANDHKGVCIEYTRPKKEFLDVQYRKNICLFDLEYITRKYLGHLLSNEKIDMGNKYFIKRIIRPFTIKSRDWKYEEEVRCVFTKESKDVYLNENHYLFKMPSLPTKIFIGCKVDKKSEAYRTLIKEASNKEIKIIEMEASETKFAVIPNEN